MTYTPYEHQTRAKEALFQSWTDHRDDAPLLVLPTASGKSVICADIVQTMFSQWPDFHPRTVVLVPSKELAEQNAAKLVALLPDHITVGYVSASLGKKQHHTDVIVATIGSIFKNAHLLGNIKCVIIDEAHLCGTQGESHGMYRKFLTSLARFCEFRTVGMTATPFNQGGYWLTDGEDPLFKRIAFTIGMRELLDKGFLSPLVPPAYRIETRIDASEVGTANGDYKVGELSDAVERYLADVARETVRLAAERKKWIAFTPSVANANSLSDKLNALGIDADVVVGETPKRERELLIERFRRGELRALVSVVALSIGFDVPDVDCLIWCRPTKSLNLYVQGFGRAARIAPGKTDALVLDFTDTVERLGPVDMVKGKVRKGGGGDAPYCICPECGERNHAAALICALCGAIIREPVKEEKPAVASRAAVLSSQLAPPPVVWHDVSRVGYAKHHKEGKPATLRVDYYDGLLRVASEWVCFDHTGYARQKAEKWWSTRWKPCARGEDAPDNVDDALNIIERSQRGNSERGFLSHEHHEDPDGTMYEPTRIATRLNGRFTEVLSHEFARTQLQETTAEDMAS